MLDCKLLLSVQYNWIGRHAFEHGEAGACGAKQEVALRSCTPVGRAVLAELETFAHENASGEQHQRLFLCTRLGNEFF